MSESQKRNTVHPSSISLLVRMRSRRLVAASFRDQNALFLWKVRPLTSSFRLPCQNELSQKIRTLPPFILKSGCPTRLGCVSYSTLRFSRISRIVFSRPVPRLLIFLIRLEVSLSGNASPGTTQTHFQNCFSSPSSQKDA